MLPEIRLFQMDLSQQLFQLEVLEEQQILMHVLRCSGSKPNLHIRWLTNRTTTDLCLLTQQECWTTTGLLLLVVRGGGARKVIWKVPATMHTHGLQVLKKN